jgi:hypothetical protein
VILQVLTAAIVNMAVFWAVTRCEMPADIFNFKTRYSLKKLTKVTSIIHTLKHIICLLVSSAVIITNLFVLDYLK